MGPPQRGYSTRTDFPTPLDTDYHLVLTNEGMVYNTESQRVTQGMFTKKWTVAPLQLPITVAPGTIPGRDWQNTPSLSDAMRYSLTRYMQGWRPDPS